MGVDRRYVLRSAFVAYSALSSMTMLLLLLMLLMLLILMLIRPFLPWWCLGVVDGDGRGGPTIPIGGPQCGDDDGGGGPPGA